MPPLRLGAAVVYISIPTNLPICVDIVFGPNQGENMAPNNASTSPSGDHANVGSSGEPRGPNLNDLGHTGPKTGDEALTKSEQHVEMSQHEIRNQQSTPDEAVADGQLNGTER